MSRSVLVVDDSAVATRQLVKIVEGLTGFTVVATAVDGTEGIKLYERHKPDLVFLDVVMPVLNGIECLRTIMQITPTARVVVVSSLGAVDRDVEEALRLGARGVINKPFDAKRVADTIAELFEEDQDHA
jgi:two-component system, chemotaxis family, chemotaxis protein CheY